MPARCSVKMRDSPAIALTTASMSRGARPRNAPSRAAPRSERIMSRAVSSSTGRRRIATSLSASTITPPRPATMIGPYCGSSRTPDDHLQPVDHLLDEEAFDGRFRIVVGQPNGHRRGAAERTAAASVRWSDTPPTSVLWAACGENDLRGHRESDRRRLSLRPHRLSSRVRCAAAAGRSWRAAFQARQCRAWLSRRPAPAALRRHGSSAAA